MVKYLLKLKLKFKEKKMKIFKNLFITLLGLAALSMIVACPTNDNNMLVPSGGGGDTNTNTGGGNGGGGNAGDYSNGGFIFADGASVAGVPEITQEGEVGLATANGNTEAQIMLTEPTSDGADGSANYFKATEPSGDSAGAWGVFFWNLENPIDVASNNNLALTFYVRSAVAGANSIGIQITANEIDNDAISRDVFKTFTADGTWQKVTVMATEFTAATSDNIPAAGTTDGQNFDINNGIKTVAFVLNDILASSAGATSIDIDEIRFEVVQ